MLKLLRNMGRREWTMAAVCTIFILGQIYFDLSLPDYMSSLTVLIKTPGSTMGISFLPAGRCWAVPWQAPF